MIATIATSSSGGRARAHSVDTRACCWAVLTNMPSKAGTSAMAAAAEPYFPIPLERLELRFVRIGTGVVVCGIEREQLDAILADTDTPPASIHPAGIPAEVTEAMDGDHANALRPEHFEFRTGKFEPSTHRRRRVLVMAALSAAILIASLATAHRWQGESSAMRQAAATLRLETDAALRGTLATTSPRPSNQPSTLDPRLELASVLNQLRRTRAGAAGGSADTSTIVPPWLSLLRAWPAEPRIAVDRLVLTPQRLTIDGRAAGIDDAERLRVALEAFHPGWQRVAYRYTDPRQNAQPFVFEFEATGATTMGTHAQPAAIADNAPASRPRRGGS